MENPIKIDDLGVPLFLETPKSHKSAVVERKWLHKLKLYPWTDGQFIIWLHQLQID